MPGDDRIDDLAVETESYETEGVETEEVPLSDVYMVDHLEDIKELDDPADTPVDTGGEGVQKAPSEAPGDGDGTEAQAKAPAPPLPAIPKALEIKKFNIKNPDDTTTRSQRTHHRRLCLKLGIPYDVADQTVTLFYNTKGLLHQRISELDLIIRFEELMGVRPQYNLDLLRILHYRTDVFRRQSTVTLESFQEAMEELRGLAAGKKMSLDGVKGQEKGRRGTVASMLLWITQMFRKGTATAAPSKEEAGMMMTTTKEDTH